MELKNLCLLMVALFLRFNVHSSYAELETTFDKFDETHQQDLGSEKIWEDFIQRQEENEMTGARKFDSEVNEEMVRQAETIADEDLLSGLNRILKNNETLEDVMKIEGITRFP